MRVNESELLGCLYDISRSVFEYNFLEKEFVKRKIMYSYLRL